MKHYLCVLEKSIRNRDTGNTITMNLYKTNNRSRNGVSFVGNFSFIYGSCKGLESEAMDLLLFEGEISKPLYGDGYYHRDNGKFTIQLLGPSV